MLYRVRLWQFALKQAPEREARLLGFAAPADSTALPPEIENLPRPNEPVDPTVAVKRIMEMTGQEYRDFMNEPEKADKEWRKYLLNLDSFGDWLAAEVKAGRVSSAVIDDPLKIAKLFIEKTPDELKDKYRSRILDLTGTSVNPAYIGVMNCFKAKITAPKKTTDSADGAAGEDDEEGSKTAEQLALERAGHARNAMREKYESAIKKMASTMNKMTELRERMEDRDLQEAVEKYGDAELAQKWKEHTTGLRNEAVNTAKGKTFTQAMMEFWNGEDDWPPQRFLDEHGSYFENLPYDDEEMKAAGKALHIQLKAAAGSHPKTTEEWKGIEKADRIITVGTLLDGVRPDEWLEYQVNAYDEMEEELEGLEGWIDKIEKQIQNFEELDAAEASGSFIKNIQKIRWYSINNYIDGIKEYGAAWKRTWDQRNERFSADIARKVGRAMSPFIYGEEVAQILDQQLDAKSNEEAEAMKKQLETNSSKWEDLFAKGDGVFWKYAEKNPNKTRGILEYAADHGFLYDVDEEVGHNQAVTIYGRKLEDLCFDWTQSGDSKKTENYFTSLRGKNSAGREHEIDHGKKMEKDVDNIPRFIALLEHEMDEHNLWAAAGICERAMERGLDGEVSAWLLTTVMSKLREHPGLAKVAPVAFFDIIGKLGMYNTAFTLGWAKGYRGKLTKWAHAGADAEADRKILETTQLKHLSRIEKEILELDPSIDEKTPEGRNKLNRSLAQILAGQIVKLPNGYVHIFDPRFKEYRDKVKEMFASATDPHKEDSDYAVNVTEKGMLPAAVFDQIMEYTSTREFKSKAWVEPFFGSIILVERQLRKIGDLKEAHASYREEISEKMDNHFKALITEKDTKKQLLAVDPRTGKHAIASLVASKLLTWKKIAGAPWFGELCEQIKQEFPDFYLQEMDGKIPPKKKTKASSAEGEKAAA